MLLNFPKPLREVFTHRYLFYTRKDKNTSESVSENESIMVVNSIFHSRFKVFPFLH